MINETNSKVEQGNDNLIACDGNGNSTATELLNKVCYHIRRDTAAIAAAAAAAAVP